MPERFRTSEFSERDLELIEQLKRKGPSDPESHILIATWSDEEKERVESDPHSRTRIEFNLKRAKIYRAAKFYRGAWEDSESVRQAAFNEGEQDLFDQAMALMDEIDSERG